MDFKIWKKYYRLVWYSPIDKKPRWSETLREKKKYEDPKI